MRKLIYKTRTGRIIANVPTNSDCEDYSMEPVSSIQLASKDIPDDWINYKIINNKLIKMTDEEINEARLYGKILTEEERLLNKLKPSQKEIQKSENTIEILTLIQEVI